MSIASNLFFVNVLVKYILQVMDELSPMPVVRCSYVTMVGFTPLSVETEGMYSCTIRHANDPFWQTKNRIAATLPPYNLSVSV